MLFKTGCIDDGGGGIDVNDVDISGLILDDIRGGGVAGAVDLVV